MYLINNDFLYILFPTILYLMIPSRYTCSISVNERYLVQYIYTYLPVSIVVKKSSSCIFRFVLSFYAHVHAHVLLITDNLYTYMYLYIKFQAILNYLRTGELHLPSFICGPAAREELLVIPLDVFIIIINVLKELTRVIFDSGNNNFWYK